MKITDIKQNENIFYVKFIPNFFEWLIGFQDKLKMYKRLERDYVLFPGTGVYVDEDGNILGPTHKVTAALDNWQRRITHEDINYDYDRT